MSATVPTPPLVDWVQRLTPAQVRHLALVVNNDALLPRLPTAHTDLDDDVEDEVPSGLLALIGSMTDAPADLRTNPKYLAERNARHGLPSRG
jgi:hypothetical protein